jgi:hypothetical protein
VNVDTIITVASAVVAVTVALIIALQRLGVIAPPKPASKRSDPPAAGRTLPPAAPTQAAPAALTTTARHELDGSLGRMRCDGHGELVAGQTGTVTEVRELRREVRDGFEAIGERLEKLLEWKGGIDARALALERDVGRLNSMARGGLTPRRVDP